MPQLHGVSGFQNAFSKAESIRVRWPNSPDRAEEGGAASEIRVNAQHEIAGLWDARRHSETCNSGTEIEENITALHLSKSTHICDFHSK